MIDGIEGQLLLMFAILRRFKWVFIIFFYFAAFVTLKLWFVVLIFVFFAFSSLVYFEDKGRESRGEDYFRGDWLFYRYGNEVDRSVLSIPGKPSWSADEAQVFVQALQASLARRTVERLPADLVQVSPALEVADQASGERKQFLRVQVRSRFGSLLTHFIHYASFGNTITAHYFTFLRGTHSDWDIVKFVLESPFTCWFWAIPWLMNRHSIVASISKYRDSSFDAIDLETMYALTHLVVYQGTGAVLQEAGLLTEEVRQVLQMNFLGKMKIGGQKLRIDNSPGAQIRGVSQSVQQPI